MKYKLLLTSVAIAAFAGCLAQTVCSTPAKKIFFVSDTQQPMLVEKLWLKSNNNKKATASIFASILKEKPTSLYMLGDVVGLGSSKRKWKKVDIFLDSCRASGTNVCGVLGNHEVMGRKKKGEANFQKRFPMNVKTGYVSVTDSVAVILLNSNFGKLSTADLQTQKVWYKQTIASLDVQDSVKAVIVCCHHAPYTNSKIVKCSHKVQDYFVDEYINSKKAQLFITGHAHAFEHFKMKGKDFIVIGGGGGLNQPLNKNTGCLPDLAMQYKPPFHYLSVQRNGGMLSVTSHAITENFQNFIASYNISIALNQINLAQSSALSTEELKKN
jgi:UDP-2,3-diacylglucosamine pyrophosphatase LpxH